MILKTLIFAGLFVFGACAGSFLSVLIYRLHANETGILRGRSKCVSCKTQLKPLDLIPLISYLTLRGKCRYCNKEISYMYPLIEIATGALFALLFIKFPFIDAATLQFSETTLAMYALYAFFTLTLVFTFFFDLHYMQVADEILLPAILIGLIATIAAPLTPNIIDALLGAAVAIAFFGLQILFSKGKWVGTGDLRVGAFMGVMLGFKPTIVALFLSYMIGSIVSIFIIIRTRKFGGVKIPLAPFLVMGTFLTIFFGQDILAWYLNAISLD